MVAPGSTLAALSITYFTPPGFTCLLHRHRCSPPTTTASSSATDLSPCCHHQLPHPLTAATAIRCCSTSPLIACRRPPPPSPDAVVCQSSSQPSSTAAAIVRHNCRPLDLPVPLVKFIQSTYEGPFTKILEMAKNLRREQQKRDPEAVLRPHPPHYRKSRGLGASGFTSIARKS